MTGWLNRNATAISAFAALVTAAMAVAAIIGVGLQIRAAERLQAQQAARDVYREFLTLSIQSRDIAALSDCKAESEAEKLGYEAYVEHLLYTAEHVVELDPTWQGTMFAALEPHVAYICGWSDWSGYTPAVQALIGDLRAQHCENVTPCS